MAGAGRASMPAACAPDHAVRARRTTVRLRPVRAAKPATMLAHQLASRLLYPLPMQRKSFITTFGLTLLGVVALGASPARADHRARTGTTGGISLGLGHLSCEDSAGNDCSGTGDLPAGSLSARVGTMIGSGSALSVGLWGMRHSDDNASVSQAIVSGQLRGWVLPRLWVEGGVGLARTSSEYDMPLGTVTSESDLVPAGVVGAGVEVLSDRDVALEVQLQGGAGLYRDDLRVFNVAMGVGLSFY